MNGYERTGHLCTEWFHDWDQIVIYVEDADDGTGVRCLYRLDGGPFKFLWDLKDGKTIITPGDIGKEPTEYHCVQLKLVLLMSGLEEEGTEVSARVRYEAVKTGR